ncbi:MAG: M23 family metallopeptidase [Prevotellaceae bacterium]|jgi:lipoprotein NlpD|nr:M23 family metallopeptidase [Prevotellaceae bacterium]
MKKRKKNKRYRMLWNDIKFKYKLSIINENTLEEVAGLRISKLNGFSVLFFVLLILFSIAAVIIAYTPLRNYLPGYMNSEVRSLVVENALRVDSLQKLLERQNMYIMNIQDIFRGTVQADTITSIDSLTTVRADTLMERTEREADFRRQYEETEKYNLTNLTERPDVDDFIFYRPVNGLIVSKFDTDNKHYGIDIAVTSGESVLATLDGIVLLSSYTAENGYVIEVLHTQDFISVYKHCGSLMKGQGDVVRAGEAIALVGEVSGQTGEGGVTHLHFELWHKGRAVNPELYVVF